jgi:hypothetical protein
MERAEEMILFGPFPLRFSNALQED